VPDRLDGVERLVGTESSAALLVAEQDGEVVGTPIAG
jgi:hypothetical protein